MIPAPPPASGGQDASVTIAPGGPDGSVRLAWAADAEAIGAVQATAWRGGYAQILPTVLVDDAEAEGFAEVWRAALMRPPSGRHRVLVALGDGMVVGFAAIAPCTDPDADPVLDGEVLALHVHPAHVGRGHGSRLLSAVADTLRGDGVDRAATWLLARDDAQRRFFESTGWAADGAHRELDLTGDGGAVVRQIRLHTDLGPAERARP